MNTGERGARGGGIPGAALLLKICALHTFNRSMNEHLKIFLSVSKPRIGVMVVISTALGFYLSSGGITPLSTFWATLVGTFFSGAGASALNAYLERDSDKMMERTRNRPLPSGQVEPGYVLGVGTCSVLLGVCILAGCVNLLTGFLSLLTAFLYVLVYTPLKRVTWLNTTVGAIPGALPVMGGWAAGSGSLGLGAWLLFFIMFVWQHPHFYAIAFMYRDDYASAGMKMLPVVDKTGRQTFGQVLFFSLLLLPVSVAPVLMGMAGETYLFGVLFGGFLMLYHSLRFILRANRESAGGLLRSSLVYLPLLLALLIVDVRFSEPYAIKSASAADKTFAYALINQRGEKISLTEQAAKPRVVSFFFTSCPHICPKIQTHIGEVSKRFPEKALYYSISIDPERDSVERLGEFSKKYNASGSENWSFLRASEADVKSILKDMFKLGSGEDPMEHTTRVVLLGADGKIQGYYRGLESDDMARLAKDLELLP